MKIKKLLLLFISLSLISSSSKAWDINSLFFSVKSFLVPFVNETVHNKNSFYITSAVACVASAYLINSYVKSYFEFVKKKKKEASVNARSKDDNTSLHDADKGYIEVIKALIDQGADVNAQYEYGKTQLHRAAMYDCVQAIEALIDKGANVNARDQDDKTPLHDAVMYDCVQAIEALIDNDADVNAEGKAGMTPLHIAVQQNKVEIVKALIDAGANVNAKYKADMTPLRLAVQQNKVEIVKALIDAGVDVNAQSFLLYCAIGEGNVEIVNALINAGVDVNLQNEYGKTLLHYAVEYNNVEIVKTLIDQGANVNAKYKDGLTPLHIAVLKGHVKAIKALIDKDADVNAEGKAGMTPLHIAVQQNKVEIVKALIDAGANVNAKYKADMTPLRLAVQQNKVEIVKALIDAGVDVNAQSFLLYYAIGEGNVEIVKALIDANVFVNFQGEYGLIPLHYLSEKGHIEDMKLLTESSILFNNKSINCQSKTLFDANIDTFASEYATSIFNVLEKIEALDTNIIELIFSFLLPVDYSMEVDDLALFNGVAKNANSIDKICKKHDVNPMNAINFFKYKHVAAFAKQCFMHPEKHLSKIFIAQLYQGHLLELKRYISIKDKDKKTALDLAEEKNDPELVEYLKKINNTNEYNELDSNLRTNTENSYKKLLKV